MSKDIVKYTLEGAKCLTVGTVFALASFFVKEIPRLKKHLQVIKDEEELLQIS